MLMAWVRNGLMVDKDFVKMYITEPGSVLLDLIGSESDSIAQLKVGIYQIYTTM